LVKARNISEKEDIRSLKDDNRSSRIADNCSNCGEYAHAQDVCHISSRLERASAPNCRATPRPHSGIAFSHDGKSDEIAN
jgi:hypothetical protein